MNTFTQEYYVRYSECDRNSKLKLKFFLDYAQEIAGLHAGTFGVDTLQLHLKGQCWLLSRVRTRIHSYPKIGNTLRLTTYPVGFDRLFAIRETHFEDAATGAVVADMTGLWLLADTANNRILSAERELSSILPDNKDLPVTFREIGKLHVPAAISPTSVTERQIQETQIDLNGHLNNAEYGTLLQDALGKDCYPTEFQINYQKAVPPESTLAISTYFWEQQFMVIGTFDDEKHTVAFECSGLLNSSEGLS